jgi:hypothetical protein
VGDHTDRHVQAVAERLGSSSAYFQSLHYVVPVVQQRRSGRKTVRRQSVVEPVMSGVECARWEPNHVLMGRNGLAGVAARALVHTLVSDASEAKDRACGLKATALENVGVRRCRRACQHACGYPLAMPRLRTEASPVESCHWSLACETEFVAGYVRVLYRETLQISIAGTSLE